MYKVIKEPQIWLFTNETERIKIIKLGDIDTIYTSKQKGMNNLNVQFLHPETGDYGLELSCLIRIK